MASRATKRDALADSPPRAPAHPNETRAVWAPYTGRTRRRRTGRRTAATITSTSYYIHAALSLPPPPPALSPRLGLPSGDLTPSPSAARRSVPAFPAVPTVAI